MTEISNNDGNFTILHCNSWERSAQLCKQIGKKLAVPKNPEENKKFYDVMASNGFGHWQLGIREKEGGGGWVDVDGQGLTFTNWAPNFPTSKVPPSKGIVLLGIKGKGTWENNWINIDYNALCV